MALVASAARPNPLPLPGGDAQWWAFGDHMTGQGLVGFVYTLGVHNGELIAGGQGYWLPGENPGEYIGGGYVGAWDGSRWHSLQGGFFGEQFDGPEYVRALAEYRGELIAGGRFKYANGLGTGLSTIVNNIARWDGSRWHAMGTGMNHVVSSLTVYNDELIASGVFTVAGGQDVNYIARWDGFRWRPIGEGLGGDASDFVVYDGDLLAVGVFALASGERIDGIARWDGVKWSAFGNQELAYPGAVEVFNNTLVADVLYSMNQALVPIVSTWNGAEWVPLGDGSAARLGEISDFAVYNGELYAAGSIPFYPPYQDFNRVARWDGTAFTALGSGVETRENIGGPIVSALCVHDGSLFVGGLFTHAGDTPSSMIARWDGVISPILVNELAATRSESAVRVTWRLSAEAVRAVREVHLERAEVPSGPYASETSAALMPEREMVVEDHDVVPDRVYWYRLRLETHSGEESLAGPVEAPILGAMPFARLFAPIILGTDQGVPIRYQIGGRGAHVQLEVFTASGRLVRLLDRRFAPPGEHLVSWDGASSGGTRTARGTYFVRLTTDHGSATARVVLLHR